MNLQQFKDLSVGDEVQHGMSGSVGKVTKADAHGVYVAWGGNPREFFYPAVGTSWFQWNIIGDGKSSDEQV